ncbi:MAG: 50S ribosomal protein L23 [Chloroflexi bacterium]|jgi:large subunit ribosomal protein L23|nr:50S ribosomal protein L23 [Chloroflexota bacterium]
MHPYEVLRRPLITEKNTSMQVNSKFVFEVDRNANKVQVKEAVEKAYEVKVISVNVINVEGKMRRMGRNQVKGPSWKKAIVTLEQGQTIELFEGV